MEVYVKIEDPVKSLGYLWKLMYVSMFIMSVLLSRLQEQQITGPADYSTSWLQD